MYLNHRPCAFKVCGDLCADQSCRAERRGPETYCEVPRSLRFCLNANVSRCNRVILRRLDIYNGETAAKPPDVVAVLGEVGDAAHAQPRLFVRKSLRLKAQRGPRAGMTQVVYYKSLILLDMAPAVGIEPTTN